MPDPRRYCAVCRGVGFRWLMQGAEPILMPCRACYATGTERVRQRGGVPRRKPPKQSQGQGWLLPGDE